MRCHRRCGVPQEEWGVLSGSVCDYDDYFYDGHYDDRPNCFDYDDPGDLDGYPGVYGFVGQIIMNGIMICMGRRTVGCIVYLGVMSVWCPTGVEMKKGTCMRAMLPCPGLVLNSLSIG